MKKTILSLAMLMCMSLGTMAQSDSYKQKTRELIELGTSNFSPRSMKESIKQAFGGLLQQMAGLSGQSSDDLQQVGDMLNGMMDEVIAPYIDSDEFVTDMVDYVAPTLEDGFSEEELTELLAVYKSPKGKKFLESCKKLTENMTPMMTEVMTATMTVAMGGELPPVEKVDCPEDYRTLFNEYFKLSAGAALVALDDKLDESNEKMAKIKTYLTESLPETTLRMCYPAFTTDDLKLGIEICSQDIVQRYIKATASMNPTEGGAIQQKIGKRVQEFMTKKFYKQ